MRMQSLGVSNNCVLVYKVDSCVIDQGHGALIVCGSKTVLIIFLFHLFNMQLISHRHFGSC